MRNMLAKEAVINTLQCYDDEWQNIKTIAQRAGVSEAAARKHVARCVARGWVEQGSMFARAVYRPKPGTLEDFG